MKNLRSFVLSWAKEFFVFSEENFVLTEGIGEYLRVHSKKRVILKNK
jgi:hypothetical protein